MHAVHFEFCLYILNVFFFSETQVILPLLKSDLYATLMECVNGDLSLSIPIWHEDRFAVGVVTASEGYPGSAKKGCIIHGLENVMVSATLNLNIFVDICNAFACTWLIIKVNN